MHRCCHILCLVSLITLASTTIENPTSFAQQEFDYLIVGGGTAGLTVATRLSEDPSVSVGVIDAGLFVPDEPVINTPHSLALGNPAFDWLFTSTAQPNLNGRSIRLPRGKVLGGSSAINGMVFHRASKQEYDAWSTLGNGAGGWNWDGLLQYFKKSETVTPGPSGIFPGAIGNPGSDSRFEGKTGPLQIGFNTFYSDLLAPWVNAFRAVGGRTNSDPDSGDGTGIFNAPRSVDGQKGVRSYAATAYYQPNAQRPNLVVVLQSQATRIILSRPNRMGEYVATGVRFTSGGRQFTARARKEVIISTGTFKTPQLLELSGIGNRTRLTQLGLPTLVDLPQVGENLQDHITFSTSFLLKEPAPLTWDALFFNATLAQQEQTQYNMNHTGLFASTTGDLSIHPLQPFISQSAVESMAEMVNVKDPHATPLQREQFAIQRQWLLEGKVGQLEIFMAPSIGLLNTRGTANGSYISMTPIFLHGFSRGSVHINTTDGLAAPIMNPNLLSHPIDLETIVFSVKLCRKIAETSPLAELIDHAETPSANITSDIDVVNFVKENLETAWHPVGTAALAPRSLGGVVSDQLVVFGTSNLRVVDASVIPLLIGAHTQSTVYAIAEKAADMIKRSKGA